MAPRGDNSDDSDAPEEREDEQEEVGAESPTHEHVAKAASLSEVIRVTRFVALEQEMAGLHTTVTDLRTRVDALATQNAKLEKKIMSWLRALGASLDYENIEQYLELICSKEGQPESKKQSKLKQVLEEAAMEDKTVIITTLNAAWTAPNSIFDLFLESFRIGNNTNSLLNHVLVVALDQTAYSRCLEVHPNCYALITNGVDFSGEAHFMSDDYLKMMWRRIDFLRIVLQMGYNFIFTDADILWFRRPFAHFYSHADFQIACDHYVHNSFNLKNAPNGGFKYVKSNNQTIQFYKFWYDSRNIYPEKHDQDVLNIIKFHPFLKKIKLKIMFLDTAYFGGFCEPSKDVNLACTMHANCCVGLGNKIHDLKMAINDWKNYMALPNGERISKRHTWTVPRICG
ncbi:uncharacterized protein At4g15970-like [Nicotiana sylvestris]|uniref:uncharacterized protein At4g15970-like n=1 Tax=Nicotiana sylvestris TaxID=4096 RepID=UPI00388CECB6